MGAKQLAERFFDFIRKGDSMPLNAYINFNKEHPEDKNDVFVQKYIEKEEKLQQKILEELKVGGSEDYNENISLFPLGKIPSPVRIPAWMFRKYPETPNLELDDIEKVAMAHVIHFTNCDNYTGYIECSGHIENWCKCSVAAAHNALKKLEKKGFITSHVLDPDDCRGHKRNLGYFVNIAYLHKLLSLYKMDIWT